MKHKYRILIPAIWLSLFVAIYAYCRHFLSFCYPFVEQYSFFRFSKEYAVSSLSQPGGLASYLGDFVTQFYLSPGIGPLITACLGVLMTILLDLALKKISPKLYIPFFSALPAITCIWAETDSNYYLAGTIALIIAIGFFLLYEKVSTHLSFHIRLLGLGLLSWPLNFLIGPYSLLAVALCSLAEIRLSEKHTFLALLVLPMAVLCPIILFYLGLGGELSCQLLPKGYYVDRISEPITMYFPSLSVLLSLLLTKVLSVTTLKEGNKPSVMHRISQSAIVVGLQFIALVAVLNWGVTTYALARNYEIKIFDYYARTKNWKAILTDVHLRASQNFMHTCYQNLALSSMGMMGDKFLYYPQLGMPGMAISWNKTCNSSTLLSDVYWQAGDVALAQEMAFEGMIASRDGVNPRLLMRLVQTNLVAGNYPVAEKYINLLEDTYSYAAEAKQYRKCLYSDETVLADTELGPRRKAMHSSEGLTTSPIFVEDLLHIMRNNPEFIPAYHYFGCMMLLVKDVKSFKAFIEESHQVPALKDMPISFQEAIILTHEQEPERWEELGVTSKVKQRYEEYRNTFLSNRGNPNRERVLAATFGATYWYYFMFKR